jgi:dTDP-4-dehydrorhamnose 3,5-epimerase
VAVLIPEGFAHGFQALTNSVHLLYMHTEPWTPSLEAGIRHDDPLLEIGWPLTPEHVSERDMNFPLLTPTFNGISP